MRTENLPNKYYENQFESVDGFCAVIGAVTHEELHWHEFFEFELVISGSGINVLNGISEEIKTGCLIFLTPTDFHEIKSHPGEQLEIINMHFNELYVGDDLKQELLYCVAQSMALEADVFYEIKQEFIRILFEHSNDLPLKKYAIKNCIDRILLLLFRNQIKGELSTKNKSSFEFALKYIEQHYRENITLGKIARMCHFSTSYFSKKFHYEFGETFQEYLMKKRLHFAKNLIKSTDLNITRICFESGFNNHTYFTRMFRRQFNLSPSEMRKKCRNE